MKTLVFLTLQKEGFHNWPEAAEIEPEAAFLAVRHRHMFHFRCEAEVTHTDRDIEFILAKRRVSKYLDDTYGIDNVLEFGRMSCEDISLDLLRVFPEFSKIEVSEDGENGAIVIR